MSMSQRSIAAYATRRPYDSTPFLSHARSKIKTPGRVHEKIFVNFLCMDGNGNPQWFETGCGDDPSADRGKSYRRPAPCDSGRPRRRSTPSGPPVSIPSSLMPLTAGDRHKVEFAGPAAIR